MCDSSLIEIAREGHVFHNNLYCTSTDALFLLSLLLVLCHVLKTMFVLFHIKLQFTGQPSQPLFQWYNHWELICLMWSKLIVSSSHSKSDQRPKRNISRKLAHLLHCNQRLEVKQLTRSPARAICLWETLQDSQRLFSTVFNLQNILWNFCTPSSVSSWRSTETKHSNLESQFSQSNHK